MPGKFLKVGGPMANEKVPGMKIRVSKGSAEVPSTPVPKSRAKKHPSNCGHPIGSPFRKTRMSHGGY